MSTTGQRRPSGASDETPRTKRRKFEDPSPGLKKKLKDLEARVTTMESQHDPQLQQIKQDFEHLRQAIVAQQETLEEMQKTIEEDGDEIEELRKEVRALEEKVEKLENKLSTYNVDDCVSVTNIFEMAICWHVMPDFYHGDNLTSRIQDLHDYVNEIKEIEDWAGIIDETSKIRSRQRWEEVCKMLGWPIKWERDKPPDLKMLETIASLSSGQKRFVLSSPIEISEAVEKTREIKGQPDGKIKAIVKFLDEVPAKLARCGLDYKDPQYYRS